MVTGTVSLVRFGSPGAFGRRPGQRFEQVVEEPRAQLFVHPVTGQQQVVNFMHALDVAGAVPLLGI